MHIHPKGSRGLSLVEVMIAAGLIVTISLGLFAAQNAADRTRAATREHDLAREAARGLMEEIAAAPYDSLPALYGDGPTRFDVRELTPVRPASLAGEVWLDRTTPPAGAHLTRVTVRIAWRGSDGSPNQLEVVTLKARTG